MQVSRKYSAGERILDAYPKPETEGGFRSLSWHAASSIGPGLLCSVSLLTGADVDCHGDGSSRHNDFHVV